MSFSNPKTDLFIIKTRTFFKLTAICLINVENLRRIKHITPPDGLPAADSFTDGLQKTIYLSEKTSTFKFSTNVSTRQTKSYDEINSKKLLSDSFVDNPFTFYVKKV